jgi:hypothetical protein
MYEEHSDEYMDDRTIKTKGQPKGKKYTAVADKSQKKTYIFPKKGPYLLDN